MDELIAFLSARLDEDERRARAASDWPHWNSVGTDPYGIGPVAEAVIETKRDLRAALLHMVRHDPTRVLADVAAKRAIIADLTSYGQKRDTTEAAEWHREGHNYARFKVLCRLAQPWADHPDYDDQWTPRW